MYGEKLPPHNLDAEAAVLGSLLLDGTLINTVSLETNDFYGEAHSLIYGACRALAEREVPIDQITLAQELDRAGKLEAVGGAAYLSNLIANCPTSLDIQTHAQVVKSLSISRRLIDAAGQIASIGHSADPDSAKSLDRADELLLDVRKHGVPSPIVSPRDRAEMALDRYAELAVREGAVAVETGLADLDYWLGGGFYNGEMVVIGSRPSLGKTTMLQFLAKKMAERQPVLFCSAEMSVESITDRDVAALVGEPIGMIRRGRYERGLEERVMSAVAMIPEMNIYYYEDTPLTVAKIMQAATAMKLRHGLGAIIVDYLGMLDDEWGKSAYERTSFISRRLKQLSRKINVPLIVAHQLSRALEHREDRRPELFDLRDAGKIEEDADTVLFLYREDYYYRREDWEREFPSGNDQYPSFPENIVEISVAKQRQGQANKIVKVLYDPTHQSFRNLRREEG